MKKLLLVTLSLVANHLSAALVRSQEGNNITKIIDDKVIFTHEIGNRITGQYHENTLESFKFSSEDNKYHLQVSFIGSSIEYQKTGELNFVGTSDLYLYITTPTPASIRSFGCVMKLNNISSPEAFEKQAQDWIKTEVSKPMLTESKNSLNSIPEFKELLTQALQEVVKKWKELIILFKADIDQQLKQELKREHGKATTDKLQKLKAQLTNFK